MATADGNDSLLDNSNFDDTHSGEFPVLSKVLSLLDWNMDEDNIADISQRVDDVIKIFKLLTQKAEVVPAEEIQHIHDALLSRIRDIESFYSDHLRDDRAALIYLQRLKLVKLLRKHDIVPVVAADELDLLPTPTLPLFSGSLSDLLHEVPIPLPPSATELAERMRWSPKKSTSSPARLRKPIYEWETRKNNSDWVEVKVVLSPHEYEQLQQLRDGLANADNTRQGFSFLQKHSGSLCYPDARGKKHTTKPSPRSPYLNSSMPYIEQSRLERRAAPR